MFFGYTSPSSTGSILSNLGFPSRRMSCDRRTATREMEGRMTALDQAQALVEIEADGKVVDANAHFLALLAMTADAVVGHPYSALLTEAERAGPRFRQLLDQALRGEPGSARLRHTKRDKGTVDLRIAFMPVIGEDGKVARLFGVGTDETQTAQNEAQLAAFDRSQAVIEFGLDGIVLSANENFLNTLGYTLPEIRGQHHSMFVDPSYRASPEYRLFWDKLGRGEFDAGQYKRIGKGGREVWIQASYNPILDANGKAFKVVKYATDISRTEARHRQLRRPDLRRSARPRPLSSSAWTARS